MALKSNSLRFLLALFVGLPAVSGALTPNNADYVPHEDWVGVEMKAGSVEELRKGLEKDLGRPLAPVSRARLTVVTPSEWAILRSVLKMQDLDQLARAKRLQEQGFTPGCLKKSGDGYFVAVEAPEMRAFRRDVWRLYVSRGGTGEDFEWRRWHPHVPVAKVPQGTLDEDYVYKEKTPCLSALNSK